MPNSISYTSIASILLKEINRIRNDPKQLVAYLKDRLKKYDAEGNYYPLSGLNFSVMTVEGAQGVEELVAYLENRRESGSLKWSFELHQAADKRCRYLNMGEENVRNSIATMEIGQLVSEFVTCKGHLVELTFYGFIEPLELITELLLEDGKEHKQNREQFFNHMSNFIGIGINNHEKYRFIVVMIMAMHTIKKEGYFGERRNSDLGSISSGDQVVICGHQCNIY